MCVCVRARAHALLEVKSRYQVHCSLHLLRHSRIEPGAQLGCLAIQPQGRSVPTSSLGSQLHTTTPLLSYVSAGSACLRGRNFID